MKKTISKKIIRGHEYYYLSFKKKGKLTSSYLGKPSSLKFKKYLLELTSTSGSSGFKKACTVNFQAGAPVAVVRDGYLVYVHKNGTEEYLDSKGKVVKVAHHD